MVGPQVTQTEAVPPSLVRPTTAVHASYVAAMEEFRAEGRGARGEISAIGNALREYGGRWRDPAVFAEHVASVRGPTRDPVDLCVTYWYVDGDAFLGRLSVRPQLTPPWGELLGHVGYDVRPSARRRGHATAMLRAALPLARQLGLDPALVTCDAGNVASRKVIEANGGVLEGATGGKMRYRV